MGCFNNNNKNLVCEFQCLQLHSQVIQKLIWSKRQQPFVTKQYYYIENNRYMSTSNVHRQKNLFVCQILILHLFK